MTAPLVYYITAHGYGHGVRSCNILSALHSRCPEMPVTVVTDLPEPFLRNRLPDGPFTFRSAAFDVGMVQLDSIRVDVPATLDAVTALYAQHDALVKAEADFLEEAGAALVVADIPALPLEAAHAAGRPRLAVGNFAWDWIYGAFHDRDERWVHVSEQFAEGYGKTDLLLRLPFHEPMRAFPRQEPVNLVASPGAPCRDRLAELTGADPGRPWVLLSFTSLEWDDDALARVSTIRDYELFSVMPLQWPGTHIRAVCREQVPFAHVMASVDAVVSKPGFGLVSECIVNEKPLLYAERTDFIEYPILVDAIERYLVNRHIPAADLYRGELAAHLDALQDAPAPPEQIPHDGDEVAAERIEDFYRGRVEPQGAVAL